MSGTLPKGARSEQRKTVLSFGAGLNSTALLMLWLRDRRPLDLVVFADTGDEMAESLAVAAHADQVCRQRGIEFVTVRSDRQLHERFRRDRAVPLPHRGFRSCTEKLKVAPINAEVRRRGWHKRGVIMLVGIAKDEAHRIKGGPPAYVEKRWPLVYDYGLGRQGCADVIAELWDGPPVAKSGCKGCPFIGERGFLELARTDRAAFTEWRLTEERARRYPANRLFADGSTLAQIQHRAETEKRLDAWVRPAIECGVGTCSPEVHIDD